MVQNKQITLDNIADQIGVSCTTVSRVLTGQSKKYRISDKTTELVQQTARELGYFPDQLARALRTKRTNTMGLIIPDISNPFFSTIARNIEIQARKVGNSIILADSQEDTQLEIESIRLLQSRKVDGLIICPVGEESAHLKSIISSGLPMVIIDRYFPDLNCAYVVSDNYQGALEAVKYFFEMNHRSIGYIQGRINTSVNDERIRGYRDAHSHIGEPVDETLIVGDSFGKRNGYIGAKILLAKHPRPTAIFAASNLISLGAMTAIQEEGLKIPDDISIISFDEQPYSEYLATPMTTVAQQTSETGEIAFKLLQAQIQNDEKQSADGIVLPTELVFRKSVKKLNLPTSTR
ncbi:MAG: LacI family DNA-binding transcriptional regulator [Candidatus Marinimicrobia bacterium]|nr:LacI family DNA-binding transcriptional regulator [Candidatus Neomarinimicrobiota bacterium]